MTMIQSTTWSGWLQIALYFAALLASAKPLGLFMAHVFEGRRTFLSPVLGPVERAVYRLAGVRLGERGEQDWRQYTIAMLLFNVLGMVALYALQRTQGMLPLNPQGFGAVSPDSAFNTAVSFATNTNWQGYGGETTMSNLTQMSGLGVQNFLSAASGIAVVIALIRGLARRSARTIGNFWVDIVRATLYVLLPLALIWAVALCSQGVIQTFTPFKSVTLVQPAEYDAPKLDVAGGMVLDAAGQPATERVIVTEQTLPMGPVASQLAIKHLGTNGGGFFNANAAHPYENPTPFSDFMLVLGQTLIAAALCYTLGAMVGDRRQGWAILAAMLVMLVILVAVCYGAEATGNPALAGADQVASAVNPGGNMEGKEVRFGIPRSALFATTTTATSCGAVNSMHDSFTPLGGLVPMWNIQLGEVVLGGVGSGLYGMLMFVVVVVFVAGLMVGRTPEYLAKKIGPFEMKMASLAILITPLLVLVGAALAVLASAGRAGVANPGAHGFSEILYATSSASNNNGSAFAGLSANTPFYNTLLATCMFFGRFLVMVPVLAIAGSLAAKRAVAVTEGTLPTHTPLFVILLISTIVIVGALTFVPSLALGPIVEQLQMMGQ